MQQRAGTLVGTPIVKNIIVPSVSWWDGTLVGLDDYLNGKSTKPSEHVVVQITGHQETDLFMMYNRQEGLLDATNGIVADKVNIVSQERDNGRSTLLVSLGVQQEYRVPNWEGSKGNDLVIKICSITISSDSCFAHVIAYVDNGVDVPSCDGSSPPTCNMKRWIKNVSKIRSNGKEIRKSCSHACWLSNVK